MRKNLRLVKISELDFLVCLQRNLFGRNTDFIKYWNKGDIIVFVVGDCIAGVSQVIGDCFKSDNRVWLKDANRFRLPISFTHVFPENERPPFSKHKQELEECYGRSWGNVFVLRKPLPDHIVRSIMKNINSYVSDHSSIIDDIDIRIYRAIEKEKEEAISQYRKIQEKCEESEEEECGPDFESKKEILIERMVSFIRGDPTRLGVLNKSSFVSSLSEDEKKYLQDVDYEDVRDGVVLYLKFQGLLRPVFPSYGPGTYLIIGDTHGDHTKSGMLRLIDSMVQLIEPDRVFHIGHALDDNGIINRDLKDIDNLTFVSRIEEAYYLERFYEENENSIDIVRDGVMIGDIKVSNQDIQTDYMTIKPSSPAIRRTPYRKTCVLAHHLHELDVAQSNDESRILIGYPGCLCEKHVESLRKVYRKKDGSVDLKNAPWHSRTQRRKWAIKEGWEQGVFIIHLNCDGSYSIIPCRIKKVSINGREQYATSYFDKIICEDGIKDPDVKTFINTDLHIPMFDPAVLHIQDRFVSDYKPDIFVNLGDTRNTEALNHHKLSKGQVVTQPLIEEGAAMYHVLKGMAKWADERYLIFGNHERFARDFIEQYPQFKGLIDFELMSGYQQLGYRLVDHQEKLDIGDVVYLHGDVLRGRSAGPLDALAGAFPDKTVVCGHFHYACIRKGCYCIPQSGLRYQHYNEKTITRWCHGFGICNQINGVSFVTPLVIEDNKVTINGKTYQSSNTNFWKNYKYLVEINYIAVGGTK